jgi:polyisoprenoid-binding protein YceI
MTATLGRAPVAVGRWIVDPGRSTATFTVRNFGVRTVRGSVPVLGGAVEVSEDGSPRLVHAELDLGGIATGNRRRDADLRKPALLALDAHPVLTFRADDFEDGPQGWRALGSLRARGTTCPLTVLGVPATTGEDLHLVGTAVLDRTALGIRAPRLLIGRDVAIVVDTWLTPA